MTKHRSVSRDDNGDETQINYTEERDDGKIETRHLDSDSKSYTGKTVHNPETGESKWYNRYDGGLDSCCYITTSCLRALDKPQDSLELKAMKVLTKEHILKSREGKRDYIHYGRKAPGIVGEIEARPDRMQIWESVYPTLQRIASLVFEGKHEESHMAYKDLVISLDAQTSKN